MATSDGNNNINNTVNSVGNNGGNNDGNNNDQFRTYLERNLRYLTRLVAHAEPIPSPEIRSQALHTLSYALGAPESWHFTRDLLLHLAPKMEQAGHRYDWLPYLQHATAFSQQLGDWASTAEFTLQQGILHRLLSEFDLAQSSLQHSIALCQQQQIDRIQARALNELAWVEYLQSQTASASDHVQQALALLPANDPERAMCYRVQGMIAIAHERWSEAETLHRQALAIFESAGDQRKMAWSLQNLAYALRGQQRFEEAIGYYEQAAESLQQMGDLYHWSVVQMNLGISFNQFGKPEIALNHYTTASSIPHNIMDAFHQARLSLNIAVSLLALAHFPNAESKFQEAIQLYSQIGSKAWRLNAMDGLAMTYIGWQKFDQAIQILQQALVELPAVLDAPNYPYLFRSLHQHWEEAHKKLHGNSHRPCEPPRD